MIGCWRISVNRYLLVAHSPASAHSEHDSFSSAARTNEADANRSNVMIRFMAEIMSLFSLIFMALSCWLWMLSEVLMMQGALDTEHSGSKFKVRSCYDRNSSRQQRDSTDACLRNFSVNLRNRLVCSGLSRVRVAISSGFNHMRQLNSREQGMDNGCNHRRESNHKRLKS